MLYLYTKNTAILVVKQRAEPEASAFIADPVHRLVRLFLGMIDSGPIADERKNRQ